MRDQGGIDERACLTDATLATAKGAGDEIGPTKRGKGVEIMAIVDRHRLPLSASTHAANHHEVTLVRLRFDCCMIEARPGNLIGDKAYDSDELDASLEKQGVGMSAPHRSNRKLKTQDGCRPRRYERRWLVERHFAWPQWKRRILIRWECYAEDFLGFVRLASITMLVKRI
jgi:transposase